MSPPRYFGQRQFPRVDPDRLDAIEIVGAYGETIQQIIHEKSGDRVKAAMNGKFLPYKTW